MQQPFLNGLSRLNLHELDLVRNHCVGKCEQLQDADEYRLAWLFGEIAALTQCEIDKQKHQAKENLLNMAGVEVEWTGKQDEENSCEIPSLNEFLDSPEEDPK